MLHLSFDGLLALRLYEIYNVISAQYIYVIHVEHEITSHDGALSKTIQLDFHEDNCIFKSSAGGGSIDNYLFYIIDLCVDHQFGNVGVVTI